MSQSRYLPTGIRIGTDLTTLGRTIFNPDFQQYELMADVDFHNFYLAADFGISEIEREGEAYLYSNTGSYYRIGFDYNLLGDVWYDNLIIVGLRYGGSNFQDEMFMAENSPYWGDFNVNALNPEANANWMEALIGLRVNVFYNLFAGFSLRHKFSKRVRGQTGLRSYDIPGFGLNDQRVAWALNYHVYYRLVFRKKKYQERP
jgi:hypothetical protein